MEIKTLSYLLQGYDITEEEALPLLNKAFLFQKNNKWYAFTHINLSVLEKYKHSSDKKQAVEVKEKEIAPPQKSNEKEIEELKEEIKRLNEVIQNKDELLASYALRFADMATQAQTIATQAQILQAADKKKSIFSRLLLLGKGK